MISFDQVIYKASHFGEAFQMRVGGLANLVSYFLPPYLESLKANGKNRVTISTCLSNEELIAGIENESLDIALLSNAELQKSIAVIPLMTEPLFVVFPKEHRLSTQRNVSFIDVIMNEKLVLYKDPCTIRASIRKQCNQMKIVPNIVVELDLTESLLTYVSRGEGITLLPSIVANNIQSPLIGVREITQVPIYREISVAMKKENILSYLPLSSVEDRNTFN